MSTATKSVQKIICPACYMDCFYQSPMTAEERIGHHNRLLHPEAADERQPATVEGHDCIDINNNPTGKSCAACAAESAQPTTVEELPEPTEAQERDDGVELPEPTESRLRSAQPTTPHTATRWDWFKSFDETYSVIDVESKQIIAESLSKELAVQIATEHNAHTALVEALNNLVAVEGREGHAEYQIALDEARAALALTGK